MALKHIQEASYHIYPHDDVWHFLIYFDSVPFYKPNQKPPEDLEAEPNVEVAVILSSNTLKSGQIITQKDSWDDKRRECLTNIYYFEHESVEDLTIEILEYHPEYIKINMKGLAFIHGNCDSSSELIVKETLFYLDTELTKSFE